MEYACVVSASHYRQYETSQLTRRLDGASRLNRKAARLDPASTTTKRNAMGQVL